MARSYSEGPPARLSQRGLKFTKAQWKRFTPQQRRDIVQQSDDVYQRTSKAGMSDQRKRANARRRARYYAKKDPVTRREARPKEESTDFWEGYRDYFGYVPGERRA